MSVPLLLSDWSKTAKTLPESYILPPNLRPTEFGISNDIPVIDLSSHGTTGEGKVKLLEEIIKASHDYGWFQVINHGVPESLMDDTMELYKEFFELPAQEKAKFYSDDLTKICRLYSGNLNQSEERTKAWRDTLQHPTYPVEDHIQLWPEIPPNYRQVVRAYSAKTRELGLKILDLMCEGLGIGTGYFENELSKSQGITINHYPPCLNPSLTVGIGGHYDPNLLTIIQQEVYGLQILKDGKWIGVKPIPHAFVIGVALQLEVVSNGNLKSGYHRGVTNTDVARTSITSAISPAIECIIEPAKQIANPPQFKAFKYKDFLNSYITKNRRETDAPKKTSEFFKIYSIIRFCLGLDSV